MVLNTPHSALYLNRELHTVKINGLCVCGCSSLLNRELHSALGQSALICVGFYSIFCWGLFFLSFLVDNVSHGPHRIHRKTQWKIHFSIDWDPIGWCGSLLE